MNINDFDYDKELLLKALAPRKKNIKDLTEDRLIFESFLFFAYPKFLEHRNVICPTSRD